MHAQDGAQHGVDVAIGGQSLEQEDAGQPELRLHRSACPSGTDDPATSRALAQKYMVAFFERTLRHDEHYARWLTGADMAADVSAGLVTRETSHGF